MPPPFTSRKKGRKARIPRRKKKAYQMPLIANIKSDNGFLFGKHPLGEFQALLKQTVANEQRATHYENFIAPVHAPTSDSSSFEEGSTLPPTIKLSKRGRPKKVNVPVPVPMRDPVLTPEQIILTSAPPLGQSSIVPFLKPSSKGRAKQNVASLGLDL